jgi:hypothetical protein
LPLGSAIVGVIEEIPGIDGESQFEGISPGVNTTPWRLLANQEDFGQPHVGGRHVGSVSAGIGQSAAQGGGGELGRQAAGQEQQAGNFHGTRGLH